MEEIFRALNEIWQKPQTRNYFFIFAALVVILIIGLTQLSPEDDTSPCSATQYLGECYNVPRSLCETTLAVIKSSCETQVKKVTSPTQLSGPIVRNCEHIKFDRILKYTRKSNPTCTDRVQYLENWLKSNPDF